MGEINVKQERSFFCIIHLPCLPVTVSIKIVADCVIILYQVARTLKRTVTLEFTAISAIIFIHCYSLFFLGI